MSATDAPGHDGADHEFDAPLKDFDRLIRKEALWIRRRRKRQGVAQGAPPAGLALSGGGIRSATFSLGLLQALGERGVLRYFDYLSTVSGGSYIGSALGALFVPAAGRGGDPATPRPAFDPQRPFQSPRGEEAVRRLRDSGRYLTPAGTSDAFFGAAVVLRNWLAIQLAIGAPALLLFWSLIVVDTLVFDAKRATFSAALIVLLVAAGVIAAGSALAYWLTRRDWIPGLRRDRVLRNLFAWALLAMLLYATGGWWAPAGWSGWFPPPLNAAALLSALTIATGLVLYAIAEWDHGKVQLKQPPPGPTPEQIAAARKLDLANPRLLMTAEDRVRTALSRMLSLALMTALALTGLLLVDALGRQVPTDLARLLAPERPRSWTATLAAAWPTVVAILPPLLSWLGARRLRRIGDGAESAASERRRRWAPRLLLAGGLLLLAAWLVLWSAAAHALADHVATRTALIVILVALAALNYVESLSFSFLNLSSLSTFYAARLRRAYIGASSYGTRFTSVKEDDPEDAIRLQSYYREGLAAGAPLHLINVTVAETVPSGSNLVARDRKGKPMHLSPVGIVFEGAVPGQSVVRDRRWGEELPLANWIAISGAAVSAAIGSGTSLGISILATMVNSRLGYWWKQTRSRSTSTGRTDWFDTVQNHLLAELRGAFRGTKRARWYLTDGGHFENTGAYPLLQRRLPFILVSDNGADPEYRMEDLVRLVSRARVDLGAHIEFLGESALAELIGRYSPMLTVIGPLSALVRGSRTASGGPVAALARITYRRRRGEAEDRTGWLLVVKPRLTFLEPPEVLAYQAGAGCVDFPQQTTGDQFFDEAQWEAYRRLGELAGLALFPTTRPPATRWMPADALNPRG